MLRKKHTILAIKLIGSSLIIGAAALPFGINLTACGDGSKTVNLISLNDFHGNLDEDVKKDSSGNITSISHPGALRLANSIYDFETSHKNDTNFVLGAGDLYQGTYISNTFRGESTGNILNALGMKLSCIGNHEFDWGQQYLGSSKGSLEQDMTTFYNSNNGNLGSRLTQDNLDKEVANNFEGFVAANIYNLQPGTDRDQMDFSNIHKYEYREGDTPITWSGVEPYHILTTADGFKIAFVGYTTVETYSTTLKTGIEGVTFLDAADPTQAAELQKTIDEAHTKSDMTVLLAHEGASPKTSNPNPKKLADWNDTVGIIPVVKNLHNLDLVLSAHTHQEYNLKVPDSNGKKIPVVQAEKYGDRFSKVSISYKQDSRHFKVKKISPEIINVNEQNKKVTELDIRQKALNTPANSLLNNVISNYDFWVAKGNERGNFKVFDNAQNLSLNPQGKFNLNSIGSGVSKMLWDSATLGNEISFETSSSTNSKYQNAPKIALFNQGGIRTEEIPAGEISYKKWYTVLPFDNTGFTFAIKVGNFINSLNSTYQDFGMPQWFSDQLRLIVDSSQGHDTRIGMFSGIEKKNPDGTYTTLSNDEYIVVLTNDFFFQNGDHATFNNPENQNGADPDSVNDWSGYVLREVIKNYYQNKTFTYNFDSSSLLRII